MIGPNENAALAVLASARPMRDRIANRTNPEELAADLLELWTVLETALRSLVGGSALSGQTLVSSLRQRSMLTLAQAHALLEFLAVRDRAQSTDYRPTPADADTARQAYSALEQGLVASGLDVPSVGRKDYLGTTSEPTPVGSSQTPTTDSRVQRRKWLFPAIALVVLAGGVAGFLLFGRSLGGRTPRDVQRGVDLYASRQPLQAREQFARAATTHPKRALPHIYLGRIAREEGDWATAGRELASAVELEPANSVAHRELAAYFLLRGQYDAARRSYVRALAADSGDRLAQGYLGCSLIRLGRMQEGMKWITRAGPGTWNSCVPPMQPGLPQPAPPS